MEFEMLDDGKGASLMERFLSDLGTIFDDAH